MNTDDRTPDPADRDIREAFHRQRSRITAHVDARRGLDHIKEPSVMSRRAFRPALGAAFILIVAVGALLLIGPFGGDEEPAVSTTSLPGVTSTTVPATTTTLPGATTTTTPSPAVGWEDPRYRVVGVAAGDVLNVRERPGASNPIVGTLPPDGRVRLSSWPSIVDGVRWYGVMLEDGAQGFVNGAFLAPPEAWDTDFSSLSCLDGDATVPQAQSPTGPSDAGHVLDVLTYQSAGCERYVIVLGSGDYSIDDAGNAAATWPEGIGLSVDGTIVAVSIPGVHAAAPWAQTVDGPDSFTLATRDDPDGSGAGAITMRSFFDSNRQAAFTFLANPARIVIDVTQAPTGTGLDVAAKRGGSTAVLPIQVDLNGPGVTVPISVAGWARPFEATGIAILRTVGPAPGAGGEVEATFSGTDFAGTQVGSSYPFMTNDWTEAWGSFAFTIDELAPGTYELFVGDLSMEDGSEMGVYQVFTVAP